MNKIKVLMLEQVVYFHYINGNLFYIGSGTYTRAFEQKGRNSVWTGIASSKDGYEVHITHRFQTQKEARDKERELIKMHEPIANIQSKSLDMNGHECFFDAKAIALHKKIIGAGGYLAVCNAVKKLFKKRGWKSDLIYQVITGELKTPYKEALFYISDDSLSQYKIGEQK